uniref:helicase SRCAP-like n=1 Tax=Lonchura striata TaxID=40157 RepID=UPI000B4C8AAE
MDSAAGIAEQAKHRSPAEIAEQAKHEAEVEHRVAEMKREGFWSLRRLPKVPEPARPKVHWDYLCEEMQWLAADFAQERRWKRGVARKVVRMVLRHHEEQRQRSERAKREEQAKLRRVAAAIAREVRHFWSSVEKPQVLGRPRDPPPPWGRREEDEEFRAEEEEGEDEEDTIAAQERLEGDVDHQQELDDLAREGALPMEELLQRYRGAFADSDCDSGPGASSTRSGEPGTREHACAHVSSGPAPPAGPAPKKEISDIAAAAESLQPKGYTLATTQTSVMLNWEMELKRWCPGFKILTYYGAQKERRLKRQGWTKPNAFHVCITSYKLVLQDHQAFRRKNWKYLILDEAQNIKNFKSQRWQSLLNFNSQRRLLLTGTPLQNSLMELWSLMHFLMPSVFQSHREFREWFHNPLTGMIEGSQEYNESLVKRLHKVLRPFLLRRLKVDVEKQMPKKYEHVLRCRLSKRQRFLYDDFMGQASTKATLASGHFMSVINVLMQLRKVCNHPDLFEPRPVTSPLVTPGLSLGAPALVLRALEPHPFQVRHTWAG